MLNEIVEHDDKSDRGAKMNFFVHAHAAKYVVKILPRVCKTRGGGTVVQIKFRFLRYDCTSRQAFTFLLLSTAEPSTPSRIPKK